MRKPIILAIMLSVILTATAFAGQDMVKAQEPSMRLIPTMKPISMTKKNATKAASKKRVKKYSKKKGRTMIRRNK